MQKKQWLTFIIAILVIIIVLLLVFKFPIEKEVTTEEVLQAVGLSSQELKGFIVDKYFYDQQNVATKITLQQNRSVLRIKAVEGIDKKSARVLVDNEITTINALYGAALSPYPGQISNEIVCDERFMPKFSTKQIGSLNYSYFSLFATERFTYGACSEDLISYNAILAWTYCNQKNAFYQFEFFSPEENFSESNLNLITSFKC